MRRLGGPSRGLVLLVVALAACESDPTRVPQGIETPVVQAVLNPATGGQLILLEQTLTGRVNVTGANDPDPEEPILMGGGVPIEDAYVVVYDEQGDSAIAQERRTDPGSLYHQGGGGKGSGVYSFFNYTPIPKCCGQPPPGPYFLRVVRGGRYRLVVRPVTGGQLTAATTVPDANASTLLRYRTFNRDRDTLSLTLPPARFTKRYSIHVQTPYGPFELFTASLEYRVRGDLRNTAAKRRPLAFVPGFEQELALGAVDTNYFDFFRTSNDSVTGRGLVEHVTGGSGVFGSYAPLDRLTLTVVADVDEPIEGRYLDGSNGKSLRLYVNERSGSLTELSGSYGVLGGSTSGVLGLLQGGEISLVFLAGQTLADTLFTVRGTWAGSSISGTRNDGSPIVFTKAP